MATKSDARAQFLSDVLSTAVEGGVQYWAEVLSYAWNDQEVGRQANASATLTDKEEDDGKVFTVTLDTIAKGWGLYQGTSISGREYGKQAQLANRTNGEDGDFDADIADQIVQLGLFGEVVYG